MLTFVPATCAIVVGDAKSAPKHAKTKMEQGIRGDILIAELLTGVESLNTEGG
jgi:hypothetical protein